MDRRLFLMGLASVPCVDALAAPVPLNAAGMSHYLAAVDRGMDAIAASNVADQVEPNGAALIRKSLRSLFMVGAFGELPDEGRVHPGMQARLFAVMPEIDEALFETAAMFRASSEADRLDLSDLLRRDPGVVMRGFERIDADAAAAGVPVARRAQMRTLVTQLQWRLRHQPGAMFDEYAGKVQRAKERSGASEEWRRKMIASASAEEVKRLSLVAQAWEREQPSLPPIPHRWRPGTRALTAGAILMGIGVDVLGVGLALTFAFGMPCLVTVGAAVLLAGVITLIAGGAIRAQAQP